MTTNNTTTTNTTKPAAALVKAEKLPDYLERYDENYGSGGVRLLRDTLCKDLTLEEMGLFLQVATAKKLDPFSRQIHAMKRRSKVKKWNAVAKRQEEVWEDKLTIMTGIDGFRTLAERTHKYAGQIGPFFCAEDGVWKDVWLAKGFPAACRIGVLRADWKEPLFGVALWNEYAQGGTDDNGTKWYVQIWREKPTVMLAKCAEAITLRRAFPEEISGLYTSDEMGAAEMEADLAQRFAELEARLGEAKAVKPSVSVKVDGAPAAKALAAASEAVSTMVPTQAGAQQAAPANPPTQPSTVAPAAPTSNGAATGGTTPPASPGGPSAEPAAVARATPAREPDTVLDPPERAMGDMGDERAEHDVSGETAEEELGQTRQSTEPVDPPVTMPTPANGKKRSATAILLELRKVMLACRSIKQVDATVASWQPTIAQLAARPRAMAEAYVRARWAELDGKQATEADAALAEQLNELGKE